MEGKQASGTLVMGPCIWRLPGGCALRIPISLAMPMHLMYASNAYSQPVRCASGVAGLAVSGAVDSDGRAYVWGFNENSQLGKVRKCWLPTMSVTRLARSHAGRAEVPKPAHVDSGVI